MSEQTRRDDRIAELHREALPLIRQLESMIDELKSLGPHSLDRDNALENVREHLRQLSNR